MQATAIGQQAEQAAAEYLESIGYRIMQRNWRRRECEIDIVAYKNRVMHFVEVKYRKTDTAGSGLEYITPTKIRHMTYAARRWVTETGWRGQYMLSAIAITGPDYTITDFIACIDS